jgi:peptidoglycan biosynthesis protein MviN/MurJ (putative lipid II flippase)
MMETSLHWLSLLGGALSLAALPVFVLGYRASSLEQLRRFERWARTCFGLTLMTSVLGVAGLALMLGDTLASMPGSSAVAVGGLVEAAIVLLAPLALPLVAWSGLALVRRRRADTRPVISL